jgi:hypothetical protein
LNPLFSSGEITKINLTLKLYRNMAKAIIRTVPSPTGTHPGKAILTEDNIEWGLTKGTQVDLYCRQPQGVMEIGSVWDCIIEDKNTFNASKWVAHPFLAKGKVTQAATDRLDGRIEITVPGQPNPFDILVKDILRFPYTGVVTKVGDNVECLPTGKTMPFCDLITVLVPA